MCGRYSLSCPPSRLQQQFGMEAIPDLAPRFNIAPSQDIAAVREINNSKRELALLRWGLLPGWAKDPKAAYKMINARAETVAEKPAYRGALRARRCLVPADGFYEWKTTQSGKQPWHIHMRDHAPFAIAGLWEHWQSEDAVIESVTLITTGANAVVATIHNRMPVILAPADYAEWLDPTQHDAARITRLLRAFPEENMRAVPVGRRVNNPRVDDVELLAPVVEEK